MEQEQSKPPARGQLADFAPKLSELTQQVLFGEIWERPELSKRDRSLITVASLVALNRTEQIALPPNARVGEWPDERRSH